MNNPVNWFEIPVTNMDRAKAFYEDVFDYEIAINEMGETTMGWFPFDQSASGATGTLIKNEEFYTPSHKGSLVYFSVKEIDDTTPKIEKGGGKILVPKFSIGEHGHCCIFEDSEGNRVALHQGV